MDQSKSGPKSGTAKGPHGFNAKDRTGAPKKSQGQTEDKPALLARMKAAAAAKAAATKPTAGE